MRTALEDGSPKVHEAGNLSYDFLFTQGDMDTLSTTHPSCWSAPTASSG